MPNRLGREVTRPSNDGLQLLSEQVQRPELRRRSVEWKAERGDTSVCHAKVAVVAVLSNRSKKTSWAARNIHMGDSDNRKGRLRATMRALKELEVSAA